MIDRKDKNVRTLEVSLGLLVGYFLGAFIGKYVYGMEWDQAFLNQKLFAGLVAIAFTFFIIIRQKNKKQAAERTTKK